MINSIHGYPNPPNPNHLIPKIYSTLTLIIPTLITLSLTGRNGSKTTSSSSGIRGSASKSLILSCMKLMLAMARVVILMTTNTLYDHLDMYSNNNHLFHLTQSR